MVELLIIFLVLVAFLLLIGLAVTIAALTCAIATSAVVWSRLAFGLLIGYGMSNSYSIIPAGGFWNFLVWAVIMLGVVFLLSAFPRVDYALKFFCTTFMCYLAVEVVGMMLVGFFLALAGKTFEVTAAYEIVVKIICSVVALGMTVREMKKGPGKLCFHSLPVPLDILQKILSSLVYGGTLTFICAFSMNDVLPVSEVAAWCVFGGTTVAAFLAELFLIGHLVGQE